MGAATVVTLLGVAIAVAAIALYLINICVILNHVSFTVGTVIIGVKAIAQATEPLAEVVRDIQNNIAAIDEDLEALVTGGEPRERKPSHSLASVGYKLLPGAARLVGRRPDRSRSPQGPLLLAEPGALPRPSRYVTKNVTQSDQVPIAPESGGQYSADHIQWYPPGPTCRRSNSSSPPSRWARPKLCRGEV